MRHRPAARRSAAAACLIAGAVAAPAARAAPPAIEPLSDREAFAGDEVRFRVVPSDPDGDVPGLRLVDWPRGALFSDNGDGTRTFAWTPTNADAGSRTLVFEAFDARDVASVVRESVALTVLESADAGGNRAPEFESLTDRETAPGGAFDFRVVAIDPEGIVPSVRAIDLPPGASLDDNGDGTRQFRWRPGAGAPAATEVTFVVSDAFDPALSDARTVTLRVAGGDVPDVDPEPFDPVGPADPFGPVGPEDPLDVDPPDDPGDPAPPGGRSGAPFFVGLEDRTLDLGDTYEFRVVPRDDDGTVPGLAIDRLPVNASFTDNRDGTRTFRWRPFPIDLGDTFVSFEAIDANDPTLRTRRTIRLRTVRNSDRPVNFDPVVNGIRNPLIRVGDTLNQRVQPVDPDFLVPTLEVLDPPPGSSFPDNGDGTRTLVWPVGPEDLGDTRVTFRATDAEDPSLTDERTITVTVVEPSSLAREGRRLRELGAERGLLIGYAQALQASGLADNELYRDVSTEEFSVVTPENSHKMGWIQPFRGDFRWRDADEIADRADASNTALHGHPLVWYAQLPSWVQNLDPSEAEGVMNAHVDALVSRYRGRADAWDVVNEALEDDGTLRRSIWFRGMGEDYIAKAFRRARDGDPAATLLYNDYDVADVNAKSDAMYELVRDELARGTPIDGVGFQMHLRGDFDDFASVRENFRRFAELGVEIWITELDVAMDGVPDLERQAEVYRRVTEICLDQPACRALQTWGFTDRYSWRSGFVPLILDDAYRPKPAYYALQRTLAEYGR